MKPKRRTPTIDFRTTATRALARTDDGLAWYRMTAEIVDGHESVFYVGGCRLDRFRLNPVILLDHDNSVRSIAGHAERIEIGNDNGIGVIDLGIKFAATSEPTDAGSLAARLHAAGFLRGMSHSFTAAKVRFEEDWTEAEKLRWPELGRFGYIIDEWELKEASFVGVGSNKLALQRAQKAGLLAAADVRALTRRSGTRHLPRTRDVAVGIDPAALITQMTARLDAVVESVQAGVDAVLAETQNNHGAQMDALGRVERLVRGGPVASVETQKSLDVARDLVRKLEEAARGCAVGG